MTVCVAVLSFAKYREDKEPNPINRKLAKIAEGIINQIVAKGERVLVVAQWETARQLEEDHYVVHQIVTTDAGAMRAGGKRYLDTEDVVNVAASLSIQHDTMRVVVVANPFIHLKYTRDLFRKRDFVVLTDYEIPAVGFLDTDENLQWWCKGPIRMLTYLGIQAFGKLFHLNLHGIGEKQA